MQTDIDKKTCKMCCMEIPKKARKCPYCQHLQNGFVMFIYHPLFAGLLVSIPFFAMTILFSNIFKRGENFEAYKQQIKITDNKLFLGDTKSNATVGVIGVI